MTGALPQICLENWREFAAPAVDSSQWTAVIPAAGRGSRLGFHRPKILYPVAGRPILDWLLGFLEPNVSSTVFVLSPDGAADVKGELEQRIPGRFEVALQPTPIGMGDAVRQALPFVRTPQVLIVWGDQVALLPESVTACMRLHQGPLQPLITCPTVIRPNPYTHFDRGADGQITRLRQAREGDSMPSTGESDTGFFCFRTETLRNLVERFRDSPEGRGARTGEFNMVPVIPMAAREGCVLTPHIMSLEETVGVNSAEDAALVEEFLGRTNVFHQA